MVADELVYVATGSSRLLIERRCGSCMKRCIAGRRTARTGSFVGPFSAGRSVFGPAASWQFLYSPRDRDSETQSETYIHRDIYTERDRDRYIYTPVDRHKETYTQTDDDDTHYFAQPPPPPPPKKKPPHQTTTKHQTTHTHKIPPPPPNNQLANHPKQTKITKFSSHLL